MVLVVVVISSATSEIALGEFGRPPDRWLTIVSEPVQGHPSRGLNCKTQQVESTERWPGSQEQVMGPLHREAHAPQAPLFPYQTSSRGSY